MLICDYDMMVESECKSARVNSPRNVRHHLLTNQCMAVEVADNGINHSSPILRKGISICMGCRQEIYDQYILRVAPDLEWHAACLKCVACQQFLDETCTCFVKDGRTYCRQDYVRQFGIRCSKCNLLFRKNEYVMRARNKVYHIDCFHCAACARRLHPGDMFALREDGLFCKADHEMMEKFGAGVLNSSATILTAVCHDTVDDCVVSTPTTLELLGVGGSMVQPQLGPLHANGNGHTPPLGLPLSGAQLSPPMHLQQLQHMQQQQSTQQQQPSSLASTPLKSSDAFARHSSCSVSSPESLAGDDRSSSGHDPTTPATGGTASSASGGNGKKDKKDKPKTTRVRTVLNEKQLHTLRSIYNSNPRPDALLKEQLVEMTGLSPRVIRVWFQNKRCKDKKKQILIKQQQQQQEKNQTLNGIRIQGVGPMIAASPIRHDMPMVQPMDVHQYQQNTSLWMKPQMQNAPDYRMPPEQPPPPHGMHQLNAHHRTPFQQLIHGFGDPGTLGGCYLPPSAAFNAQQTATAMDANELNSLSPQLAASDLSSPSCSE